MKDYMGERGRHAGREVNKSRKGYEGEKGRAKGENIREGG